jgi:amino acid adenylation domain-containing protein
VPDAGEGGLDHARAPESRLQSTIAHIWEELLAVEVTGVDEDFFRLGGDSLQAIRMLAAVDEVCLAAVSFTDFVENPTVAALATAVAETRQAPGLVAAPPVLDAEPEEALAPCTSAQERLWFIEQMVDGSGVYNLPLSVRLRGGIDTDVLDRSLQDLIDRHAALRTSFVVEGGAPRQLVAPRASLELPLHDVEGRSDPEAEARQLLDDLLAEPIGLGQPPLVRAQIVRLAGDDHVLQLVFHHIVCDGWSHAVAFRELGAIYRARVRGEEPDLPDPGVQYPAYAYRERTLRDRPELAQELAWWREHLSGIPVALDLPTDRPRPRVPTYRGATRRSRLGDDIEAALRSFCRTEGVTVFATLLAAFDALLARYSGQGTIVVGTTTAGRDGKDLGDGIGLFAKTVALRCDLADRPTFRELAARVRGGVLDAVSHEDVPFERLVAEIQPEPDLTRHPIFQVFFAQVPHTPLELDGVAAEPFDAYARTSRFDLTLFVEEESDGLELVWEYSTDIFEASTIERMESHYLRLLEGGLEDPGCEIGKLPLLGKQERRELLEPAPAATPYPIACLHKLFEARAEQHPHALAVSSEVGALTYRQLNERANRLAHRLRRSGIGPDSLVAVCLGRSLEIVVGILAVLKAGGAYVPLDPEYPADRLAFVIGDTRASVLLTQQEFLDRLPATDAEVVCLDDAAELAAFGVENLEHLGSPENLAYVIYTSGSTGQPKGVPVEHRNVARLFSATDDWFGFGPDDTWLLFHSYAFDFSVWELWGALLYGGRLVITPQWTTRSPQALASLLVEQEVTVFNATPSVFVASMDELLAVRGKLRLRYVIFGGEALHLPSLRPWFAEFGADGPTLVNMYGITETTVHVTYRPLSAEDAEQSLSLIGEAIPDLQIHLLDEHLEPVPVGVPGEIYVGGAGLARGYLNRDELTAERFVSNPFGGGRLYRSGDRGRLRPDGDLEYLGRGDDQVKIRGFRIELGEVKGVMALHEAVVDAVVLPYDADAGDTRLAAYAALDPQVFGAVEARTRVEKELWTLLEAKLPGYMVPSTLLVLESLPLTSNGKVDLKSLPLPSPESRRDGGFIAPETQLERETAAIWCEILCVDRAGMNDNFFHLGGHSLLAARVITQSRKRFSIDLSVRTLFEYPTLAAFVEHLKSMGARLEETDDVRDESDDRAQADSYPLSFPQQQLFFLDELTPGVATHNAALAVRVVGSLDREALEQAVTDVIQRHEPLRTVLVRGTEGAAQVVLEQWEFSFAEVDLSSHSPAEREAELHRQLRERTREPFDLGRDLMLRGALFKLDEAEHVVLFGVHHVASDGWSMPVFCNDLAELYDAHRTKRPPRLPELPLRYRDFALWQRERLGGERLATEIAYWQAQLAGAPMVLQLPTDRPRPPKRTFEGARHEVALPREVAADVLRLCREHQATPYMLLLSVFAVLLYRHTGQDDVLVSGPFANRGRADFDNLVGFFANTLVMRVRMAGNPQFATLLARTRETTLEVLDHQEASFEHIVEAARPQRVPGVNPLAQVNFRVRVDPAATLKLGDAATSLVPVDVGFVHFDLALELNALDTGIAGEFIYNTALFDRGSIERLAMDFELLLNQVLENPEARLLSLQLPSEQEAAPHGGSIPRAPTRLSREATGSPNGPDGSSASSRRGEPAAAERAPAPRTTS